MTATYRRQERQWLARTFSYGSGAPGTYITTAEWMEGLLLDDLLPKLYESGYVLALYEQDFVRAMLRHTFDFERAYLRGRRPEPSRGPITHTEDDYDYFFNVKFTSGFWEKLARDNAIEWFADGDAFAQRLWVELPFWVAQYIDFEDSTATDDMEEYGVMGGNEDTAEEPGRKATVDPYMADYYARG